MATVELTQTDSAALPEPALEQLIAKAQDLDMGQVRTAIADRSGAAKTAGA